jgi:hypothetical protein
MGVTASLQPTTVAVTPGTSATVDVRVRNTGHVVDQLTVEVVGEAAAWATVSPASVSLFPGNDQTVTVVFTPPMAADGPAGSVPFGVRVRSQEDPNGTVVEEGVLEVASFLAVSAELQPRTSRGRKGAVHELAIDNRGTRPVSVSLAATDPDANLVFAFEPPALEVPANSAAFVKVKLRAAHPFRKGTSLTRMFDVVVSDASSGGGDPLAVAAGMFVQEETFPRWLRRALFWAVLGLIAFLLFWFLLGKPAVESVAKEAVADSSTPPTIADSSGSGGGGSGSGGGAGSGSENTDAGGADVSTGSSAGGAGSTTTIDGRLFLTEAGVTAYEVPAGSTLQVTDIVLQNPTGDTGPLQIRRNGTALLVVELGNFRDLDYHFVAPIVFTAGQKLELSATCTAGACTPGAYFAGYLIQGG